jgi:hypothetical protein
MSAENEKAKQEWALLRLSNWIDKDLRDLARIQKLLRELDDDTHADWLNLEAAIPVLYGPSLPERMRLCPWLKERHFDVPPYFQTWDTKHSWLENAIACIIIGAMAIFLYLYLAAASTPAPSLVHPKPKGVLVKQR